MPVQMHELRAGVWVPLDGSPTAEPRLLIGAASSDFDALALDVAPMTARRSYNAGEFPVSFAASAAAADVAAGRVSIWSAKPDLAATAGGMRDSAITAFVNSIPAGHPCYLTIWHEHDAKIRKGDFTYSQWEPAYRRFVDVVRAVARPRTWVFVNPTSWLWNPAQTTHTPEQVWPGDAYVDVVAIDGYSDVPEDLFDAPVAFARDHNVPWAIAECGWLLADQPTRIAQTAAYAASTGSAGRPGAEFMCWFDSSVGGAEVGANPTPGDAAAKTAASAACSTYYRNPALYDL